MKVTPEFCRAALRYDPETGKLYWKARDAAMFKHPNRAATWNARFAGQEAFRATHVRWGHKQGALGGKNFKAHIVIWAIVHGDWPNGQIDHLNGDPSDNRLENLRDVSATLNCQNKSRYKSNKIGITGVYWSDTFNRWIAAINDGFGRQVYLGSFRDINDAACVRRNAERTYGYHPNHGRAA